MNSIGYVRWTYVFLWMNNFFELMCTLDKVRANSQLLTHSAPSNNIFFVQSKFLAKKALFLYV